MSFWGDIASTAKKDLTESINGAKASINDNINRSISNALSNTRRDAIKRPERGFYSGLQAYGMLQRSLLRELNYYQDSIDNAYAVPVTVADQEMEAGEYYHPKRFELRSGLYANEYDSISSEFDEQTGCTPSYVTTATTKSETSGTNK